VPIIAHHQRCRVDDRVKDPRRVEQGRKAVRVRWSRPRIIDISALSPAEKSLVGALVRALSEAQKKSAPSLNGAPEGSNRASVTTDHQTEL